MMCSCQALQYALLTGVRKAMQVNRWPLEGLACVISLHTGRECLAIEAVLCYRDICNMQGR